MPKNGPVDWYRNTEWNAEIEAAFHAKLARARSQRPQYLVIQAGCLAAKHPEVALTLIDQYFETGDTFHAPTAWCTRAGAYETLGQIDNAIEAYKTGLDWEDRHPCVTSDARSEFPKLVAIHRIESEYERALTVLKDKYTDADFGFPASRYIWNGTIALLIAERGQNTEAVGFARKALEAAEETQSAFRYHRALGLANKTDDEFGRWIKRIAQRSLIARLFN